MLILWKDDILFWMPQIALNVCLHFELFLEISKQHDYESGDSWIFISLSQEQNVYFRPRIGLIITINAFLRLKIRVV